MEETFEQAEQGLRQLFAFRLRRWQGARTAVAAAEHLEVPVRTYENWVQGRYLPHGLKMEKVLEELKSYEKTKKEFE